MPKSMFERIQSALAPSARAADIERLLADIDEALAGEQAEQARHHAVAISASSPDDVADQSADAEAKVARRITRLSAQRDQVKVRHDEVLESESKKRRDAERAAIIAERDELAVELKERWPVIAAEMVSLIKRCDASLAKTNSIRAEPAETLARGCPGSFYIQTSPVVRLKDAVIPNFDASNARSGCEPLWPERQAPITWG